MSSRTQYEFLFVGSDEGSFVENYAYDLGEGGANSGKIFINLEIQNNPAHAEAIGETIFDSVRKAFFAEPEKDPYARFEDSIKEVNRALNAIKEENVSKFIGNLHVLIAAIVGNNLYLTQCGDAEAYLIRRRMCTNVSEGLQEEGATDIFSNIASGSLEPGDFVFFNSTRLLRYIGKTDLAKMSSGGNLVASLSELKDFLATEVVSKVGIIGMKVLDVAGELSSSEKGQIVAHLQKEEYASKDNSEKKSSAPLADAINRLTIMVRDLQRRLSLNSSSKTVRASETDTRSGSGRWGKDRIVMSFIAIVLVLTAGIWWIRSKATEQQTIEKYTTMLNEVQEEVGSAQTTGQYNKEQAGQMLSHAEEKALEVLNSGYLRPKANQLLQDIQGARDKLDGVSHPEARVIADLSEKRSNVSALGLLSLNDQLYAFEYNALYPIIAGKVQDPLTIDENETVVAGSVYDDKDSLLFYTKSGKVIEYKDNRVSFVDSVDSSFRKGVSVQAYSNRLFILDPENNQIWRYTRGRDKFDAAEQYNVNGDVKNGVSMAIDGSIYILSKDGFITKLYLGNKEDFPVKKQPMKTIENATKIFTELDMNRIFVLEPSEKRVMIYDKEDGGSGAVYNHQLVFDDIDDLRDIYVNKDTNTLYLLDATKIYEVKL